MYPLASVTAAVTLYITRGDEGLGLPAIVINPRLPELELSHDWTQAEMSVVPSESSTYMIVAELRLPLLNRINPAPGSLSVVVVEYCMLTPPIIPVLPVGNPRVKARAPVLEVKLADPVPDPEAPFVTPTVDVEIDTALTLPVVTVNSSPSVSNANNLSARALAGSENSGVVRSVTVLETFNVRPNVSCMSWIDIIALSTASSKFCDEAGSFSIQSVNCVCGVSLNKITCKVSAGADTKVTVPPLADPTPLIL